MKTCITFHPHEIALCPGPMTLLRPIHSSCLEIPSCCPYGQPGDVLAVRETWRKFSARDECSHYDDCDCARHDGDVLFYDGSDMDSHWRSPVTMPAALARWQFRVESVGARKIQDLMHVDWKGWTTPYRTDTQIGIWTATQKWDHTYPRYPWASNPLLWVMRGNVEVRQ